MINNQPDQDLNEIFMNLENTLFNIDNFNFFLHNDTDTIKKFLEKGSMHGDNPKFIDRILRKIKSNKIF